MSDLNPRHVGLQAVAVLSGSFLSGSMASLSLIMIPLFLDTNTQAEQLVGQFVRLYYYGHRLMPAISVTTCAMYGLVASRKRAAERPWRTYAIAAATTVAMVPFTWLCMVPTNNALFGLYAAQDPALDEVQRLIVRWKWLHVARSAFPLLGAVIGWMGVLGELMG
ncbi:hypothetical protein BDV10DRAFT_122801 [Aspergillus recurvatus]